MKAISLAPQSAELYTALDSAMPPGMQPGASCLQLASGSCFKHATVLVKPKDFLT
jgi:hypothetical protein